MWTRALLIVTVAAAIRLVFAALIPVFPDEAYYWLWSRRLAPGYFDHPAGVALLIRVGAVLLSPLGAGDTGFAIRLGPVIAGWIASIATIGIANTLGGPASAVRAAIIMSVMPLAAAGLVLAAPDAALLAATSVALYCTVRALTTAPRSTTSFRWWAAAGFALGLAFSSKYTSIFVPLGVVIAVVSRGDLRGRLREPGPYVACIIAALVFVPVLVWNAQHDWVSFLFQIRHGLSAPKGSALLAAWKHEGEFFGGQAGLASPVVFIMMAITVGRALRRSADSGRFMLAVVALISFGFFVYSAVRQRVEPNWPAPAYIPAIALLASAPWGASGAKWLRGGIAFAAVMSAVIYVQAVIPILPFAPPKDPIARAFGWSDLTRATDSVARDVSASTNHRTWLAGDRYQEASELSFHNPEHPTTFSTNLSGRVNQFDLWLGFAALAAKGDNLVMVVDDTQEQHAAITALEPFFAEKQRADRVVLRRGRGEIGARRIWVLRGWRGGWPERKPF